MTEQTDAAEVGTLRADLANAECACGHQAEWHSALLGCNAEDWDQPACDCRGDWLDAVLSVIRAREAAAEARGAERALREAADEVADVRENGLPIERTDIPVFSHPTAEHFEDWLRARAAAAGGAR